MRRVVLQMMTTLNGRVDDPDAWIKGWGDEAYSEIDRQYATFDTVLVGTVTYAEMAGYWPGAEREVGGNPINLRMARRMNSYRKVVVSTRAAPELAPWNNVEVLHAPDDAALVAAVNALKAQPGGDLLISGGARLAQTFVRLGRVDRYNLFVHPVLSPGLAWFDQAPRTLWLKLLSSTEYPDGIVSQFYEPVG